MKPVQPIIIVLLLLVSSQINAQVLTQQQERTNNLGKNNPSLSASTANQVRFLGLLKSANEAESLDLAHQKLMAAYKTCQGNKLADCDAKIKEQTQKVFNKWLASYQSNSNSSTANMQLAQLQAKFCKGSLATYVDCSSIKQLVEEHEEDNENRELFDTYIAQGKRATQLADKIEAFQKAEAICESFLKDECADEVESLLKSAYAESFQKEIRRLQSSSMSYEQKVAAIEELEDLFDEDYLGTTQSEQLRKVAYRIHETEIRRLLDQSGAFAEKIKDTEKAWKINTTFIDSRKTDLIQGMLGDFIDNELDNLESSSRRRNNFERLLNRIEEAEEELNTLPSELVRGRGRKFQNLKRETVMSEIDRRSRDLERTTDWRATLDGFNNLVRFAQRYENEVEDGTLRRIRRNRQRFAMGEYEARVQQSLALLQRGQLQDAQLALAGAVELSSLNILPEGPEKYRHREVYQKLYEEHHRQLQLAKQSRNWQNADRILQTIDALYQDAPFILVRASLEEELVLLDIAKFEEQLDIGAQVIQRDPMEGQYRFFNNLMDGYQTLNRYLNNQHRASIGRLAFDLSKGPMDASRAAISQQRFGEAIGQLVGLNDFLYQQGYRSVIGPRPYEEMNRLLDYSSSQQMAVFASTNRQNLTWEDRYNMARDLGNFGTKLQQMEGWNDQAVQGDIQNLFTDIFAKQRSAIVTSMQQGDFNYQSKVGQIRNLQQQFPGVISNGQMEQMEAELSFYYDYEQAKSTLRRKDFGQSLDLFNAAASKLDRIPANEQNEKEDLIKRGQQMALEGIVLTQISRYKTVGKSSQVKSYRAILGTIEDNASIPLTEKAENALREQELDWFGGACRLDYRRYNQSILQAEAAVAQEDYDSAIRYYSAAQGLESGIGRCMLDLEDTQERINFYQLAADFNQRKANLETLYSRKNWSVFDSEYQQLWQAYLDYGIKAKFGYDLIPFEQYVLDKRNADLSRYFIVNYAGDDQMLDAVREALGNLSFMSSNQQMEALGRELAIQLYPLFPGKSYKSSYNYLIPNGQTSKSFKKLKKGYKKQWKRVYKGG